MAAIGQLKSFQGYLAAAANAEMVNPGAALPQLAYLNQIGFLGPNKETVVHGRDVLFTCLLISNISFRQSYHILFPAIFETEEHKKRIFRITYSIFSKHVPMNLLKHTIKHSKYEQAMKLNWKSLV